VAATGPSPTAAKALNRAIVVTCGCQPRIVWVDNRNCAHERSFHKSLICNGKYEISRQTPAPDVKTYASQSECRNAFTNYAEGSSFRGSFRGSNSRANLRNR